MAIPASSATPTCQAARPRKNRPAANVYPPIECTSDIHIAKRLYVPQLRSLAGARSSLYSRGLLSTFPYLPRWVIGGSLLASPDGAQLAAEYEMTGCLSTRLPY